jgi:hypothetical protein
MCTAMITMMMMVKKESTLRHFLTSSLVKTTSFLKLNSQSFTIFTHRETLSPWSKCSATMIQTMMSCFALKIFSAFSVKPLTAMKTAQFATTMVN